MEKYKIEMGIQGDIISTNYKKGDILIMKDWKKDTDTNIPEIFKCIKYDEDWGAVWYDYRGIKDSIGISHIRRANFSEKLKWIFNKNK